MAYHNRQLRSHSKHSPGNAQNITPQTNSKSNSQGNSKANAKANANSGVIELDEGGDSDDIFVPDAMEIATTSDANETNDRIETVCV
ncbi:unnamed protein product [Ambrosiozyma monospora]|uniref:Unnamed protein product n=1 Tax=Ambrosiozyma monospora TaxID=43982 RepID=A0ACB5U2N7_AMBMO|nr:unnamed protein product [Ambrosiozyma monospora]